MQFRNISVQPDAPVCQWGFEGILAAFERGSLAEWHRVYLACKKDRSGKVRLAVDEALDALEQGEIRPHLASVFRLLLQDMQQEQGSPEGTSDRVKSLQD